MLPSAEYTRLKELAEERNESVGSLVRQAVRMVYGNVEGWDLVSGRANVIVCDGFVGNILLKFGEGLSAALARWLRERLANLLPPTEIQRLADELQEMMEFEKRFGGVPLLGVEGVMVVGHGRSRASGVEKAIGQAKLAVESHLIETIEQELAMVRQ